MGFIYYLKKGCCIYRNTSSLTNSLTRRNYDWDTSVILEYNFANLKQKIMTQF